jgi:UDP-glucose 4-epimerase
MVDMAKVVAVTGASGYVGTKLLQELERKVNLGRVVAIDSRPLPMPVHNIVSKRLDITGHSLDDVFQDLNVDTVVHLSFSIRPGRNRREIEFTRKSNLDGVRNVLRGCSAAKANNFIFLSSHTVYGPHRDNAVPITEEAQPRPLAEFQYSYDKWLCEREVLQFASENPKVSVTILRSCVVLGPAADNQVARGFFKPLLLGFMGNDPPWQFVHEEDMARLLGLLVMEPQQGIYNVAGNGVVAYSQIARIARRRLVRLPSVLAYAATQLAWNMGIQKESPARGLDFVRYPVVLTTGKLKKETGFRFNYSSEEVLTSYIDSNLV